VHDLSIELIAETKCPALNLAPAQIPALRWKPGIVHPVLPVCHFVILSFCHFVHNLQ
jgi:hypothetical protein